MLLKSTITGIQRVATTASYIDPCTWNEHLHKKCNDLNLSRAAKAFLVDASIELVWQLVSKTDGELAKAGAKRKVLSEIREILEEMGLHLGKNLQYLGFPRPV